MTRRTIFLFTACIAAALVACNAITGVSDYEIVSCSDECDAGLDARVVDGTVADGEVADSEVADGEVEGGDANGGGDAPSSEAGGEGGAIDGGVDASDAADAADALDASDAADAFDAAFDASGIVSLALGLEHSCVVRGDGTAQCWGANELGELGVGTTADSSHPVVVTGLSGATAIAGGREHTCAILVDGGVACWGGDTYTELGYSPPDGGCEAGACSTTPRPVIGLPAGHRVAQLSLSAGSLSLLDDATIASWGGFFHPAPNDSATPTLFPLADQPEAGAPSYAITAGTYVSCDRAGGTPACWGYNDANELGAPGPATSPDPIADTTITDAVAMCAGQEFVCVVRATGGVVCFGSDDGELLGSTNTTATCAGLPCSTFPLPVSLGFSAIGVACGEGHVCAWSASGDLACWGTNPYGQLGVGDGAVTSNGSGPVAVTIGAVALVAAGEQHTCAVLQDGTLWCWGRNERGQVGSGSTTDAHQPVQIFLQP